MTQAEFSRLPPRKHKGMSAPQPRLIDLPAHVSAGGGCLSVFENADLPFNIARVFYIYDLPPNAERGAHAHTQEHELVCCVAGACVVTTDNGKQKQTFALQSPAQALYIPPMVWRALNNFAPGAVILAACDRPYNPQNQIKNHADFLRQTNAR